MISIINYRKLLNTTHYEFIIRNFLADIICEFRYQYQIDILTYHLYAMTYEDHSKTQ